MFNLSVYKKNFVSVVQTDIVLPQLILQRASFQVCFLFLLLLQKKMLYTIIFLPDMKPSIVTFLIRSTRDKCITNFEVLTVLTRPIVDLFFGSM